MAFAFALASGLNAAFGRIFRIGKKGSCVGVKGSREVVVEEKVVRGTEGGVVREVRGRMRGEREMRGGRRRGEFREHPRFGGRGNHHIGSIGGIEREGARGRLVEPNGGFGHIHIEPMSRC